MRVGPRLPGWINFVAALLSRVVLQQTSQVPAGMPSQRVMLLVLLAAAAADAFLVSGGGCRGLVVCVAARVRFDVKTQAQTKCCQHMHVLTYMLA